MVKLTETAVGKVKEILDTQEPKPAGLRIAVVGSSTRRIVSPGVTSALPTRGVNGLPARVGRG